jgi:hypothetical protein
MKKKRLRAPANAGSQGGVKHASLSNYYLFSVCLPAGDERLLRIHMVQAQYGIRRRFTAEAHKMEQEDRFSEAYMAYRSFVKRYPKIHSRPMHSF